MTKPGMGLSTKVDGRWVPVDGSEVEEISIVERFRQTHHALATFFALGYTASNICRITGKSRRSLTLIYNNPMFRELIALKIKQIAEDGQKAVEEQARLDFQVRQLMTRNHLMAEQQLNEKLETAELTGELLSVRDYNIITSDRADRLGYSKHSVVTHTNDFASQLDRAITRSNRRNEIKTIDGEVVASVPNFSHEPASQLSALTSTSAPPVAQEREDPSPAPRLPRAPGRPSFVDALKRKFT